MEAYEFLQKLARKYLPKLNPTERGELITKIVNDSIGGRHIIVPQDNNAIRLIEVEDILFIREPKSGHTIIRTTSEELLNKNQSFSVAEFLESNNQDFKHLNNGLTVNMPRLSRYNSSYNLVYFDNNLEIAVTGVAIRNIVKSYLGKERDMADSTFQKQYDLWLLEQGRVR